MFINGTSQVGFDHLETQLWDKKTYTGERKAIKDKGKTLSL